MSRLQTEGPISLEDIATEFGGEHPHKLSEYYSVTQGIPVSGPISLSNFYGKQRVPWVGPPQYFSTSGGITSFNFGTIDIGEESPDRLVVVYMNNGMAKFEAPTYFRINGQNCIKAYSVGGWRSTSMWILNVPSGTTATMEYGGSYKALGQQHFIRVATFYGNLGSFGGVGDINTSTNALDYFLAIHDIGTPNELSYLLGVYACKSNNGNFQSIVDCDWVGDISGGIVDTWMFGNLPNPYYLSYYSNHSITQGLKNVGINPLQDSNVRYPAYGFGWLDVS